MPFHCSVAALSLIYASRGIESSCITEEVTQGQDSLPTSNLDFRSDRRILTESLFDAENVTLKIEGDV